MRNFTPRHLRRRYAKLSGTKDKAKQDAFRKVARRSKKFIHQSSDALAHPRLNPAYRDWCGAADRDGLRKA